MFGLCYAIAFLGVMMNPRVRKRLGAGVASPRQRNWSNLGLVVLGIGCCAAGLLLGRDARALWLTLLLIVGAHFLFFIPVHGRLTGVLGILLVTNALVVARVATTTLRTWPLRPWRPVSR